MGGYDLFKYFRPLKAIGSLMILLVLGIVWVNYHSIVVRSNSYGQAALGHATAASGAASLGRAGSAALVLVFHLLVGMLLWCYFSAVFADNSVPAGWLPDEAFTEDGERLEGAAIARYPDPKRLYNRHGRVRFCRKCREFKPPRSHHCSICGKCVLKMDHHCIWVVNCVGNANYKAFLLFLFYTLVTCTYAFAALLPDVLDSFASSPKGGGMQDGNMAGPFLAAVLDIAFVLAVTGFIIMHFGLVRANTTTIESFEKLTPGRRWMYDVGAQRNWEQVMGARRAWWLVPCYSPHDRAAHPEVRSGLDFPVAMLSEGMEGTAGSGADIEAGAGGSVRSRGSNL